MQQEQKKVTIIFQSEGEEVGRLPDADGFLITAWNFDEEGRRVSSTHTSTTLLYPGHDNPVADGMDLVHVAGALALNMQEHPVPAVRAMGEVIRASMSKSLGYLEAVARGELPEG